MECWINSFGRGANMYYGSVPSCGDCNPFLMVRIDFVFFINYFICLKGGGASN